MDKNLHLQDILGCRFRANSAFKLVEHGRLLPEQREIFQGLAEQPDHFGLLVPRDAPELGVMAVDCDSAFLLLSLQEPGGLPNYLSHRLGSAGCRMIATLVLDGILEIESDGNFLTGPAAFHCVIKKSREEPLAQGKLGALSHEAMKFAQALPIHEPELLSTWLYSYHRLPMSPAWARRFSNQEHIDEVLGLQRAGPTRRILDEKFLFHKSTGWLSWRNFRGDQPIADDQPTYKLYISLHPDTLIESFPLVARYFAEAEISSFKLGSGVFGLLRPDKLVAYFADYEALERLATSLSKALAGCPAHGVPFTAALTEDGLLSWGMDPPRNDQIPGWRGVESWRIWVTNRVARAILRAKALGSGSLEPWQYALLRLRLEGVQSQSWLPAQTMWTGHEVPS